MKQTIQRAGLSLLVFFLFLVFAAPLSSRADVIFGPEDDSEFYSKHYDELKLIQHVQCYAKNTIRGVEEPGGNVTVRIPPNDILYVTAIYPDEDGNWWGFAADGREGSGGHGGRITASWFPLDELYLVYRPDDFETDHEDEIYRDRSMELNLENGQEVFFHEYPCSESCYDIVIHDIERYSANLFFTDYKDRVWAHLRYPSSYRKGKTDLGWVCLDDPENDRLGDGYYDQETSALRLTGAEKKGASSGRGSSGAATGTGTAGISTGTIVLAVCVLFAVWVAAIIAVVLIIRKRGGRQERDGV